MKVYMKSDIGLVRETNQDACQSGKYSENSAWVVVCDGMGGANGGNIASGVAVSQISERLTASYEKIFTKESTKELLLSSIADANIEVHAMASADAKLNGMGTTVVVAIVTDGAAHIAHAGDSRAYMITDEEIRQLTTDHSMVQEMLNNGEITREQAKLHPQKNIITRALGVDTSINIDYCEVPFSHGNLLLICTDGLTNYMDAEQIFQLSRQMSAQALTDELIAQAKNAGGGDNITVAIVEN